MARLQQLFESSADRAFAAIMASETRFLKPRDSIFFRPENVTPLGEVT